MSEHEAGRELDALVAEREMDAEVERRVFFRPFFNAADPGLPPVYIYEHTDEEIPYYSTDIAAAWEVVEHFQAREWWVRLIIGRGGDWTPGTDCEIGRLPDLHGNPSRLVARGRAYTAPLAICRAALAAVEASK